MTRLRVTLEMSVEETYALIALTEAGVQATRKAALRQAGAELLAALDRALVSSPEAWAPPRASPRAQAKPRAVRPRASPPPPARRPDLAADALEAARGSPSRWDGRVFISDAYATLRASGRYPSLSLDAFKAELVEASRADRITLGRPELPHLLPEEKLRASLIEDRGVRYVFIKTAG